MSDTNRTNRNHTFSQFLSTSVRSRIYFVLATYADIGLDPLDAIEKLVLEYNKSSKSQDNEIAKCLEKVIKNNVNLSENSEKNNLKKEDDFLLGKSLTESFLGQTAEEIVLLKTLDTNSFDHSTHDTILKIQAHILYKIADLLNKYSDNVNRI